MTIDMVAVTPEGELRDITVATNTNVLRTLYEAIGCQTVQLVRLDRATGLWVDEEGRLRGLPGNAYATVVAHSLGWRREVFVGTAVFSGISGERTVSIAYEVRELLAETVTVLGPGGLSEPRTDATVGRCPCACNSGGFCGGCGHAGCGGRR